MRKNYRGGGLFSPKNVSVKAKALGICRCLGGKLTIVQFQVCPLSPSLTKFPEELQTARNCLSEILLDGWFQGRRSRKRGFIRGITAGQLLLEEARISSCFSTSNSRGERGEEEGREERREEGGKEKGEEGGEGGSSVRA